MKALRVLKFEQLKTIPVQSKSRTTPHALKDLQHAVSESGLVVPPVVFLYRNCYYLVDGYRRVETQRAAGLVELEFLVIDLDEVNVNVTPEILFALLNRSLRKPSGVEWQNGFANAARPDAYKEVMPPAPRKSINALIDILDQDRALELLGDHAPTTLARVTQQAANIIGTYYPEGEQPTLAVICEWAYKHNMAGKIPRMALAADKRLAVRLQSAIENDRPLKFRKRVVKVADRKAARRALTDA